MTEDYEKDFLGKGFHFPVEPDTVTGKMKMSAYEDSIREAVYIVIMTRKGERVMQPEFGCDIQDFTFETMDFENLTKMETSVKNALILWEPRIENVEVSVIPGTSRDGMVNIDISYTVRATNNPYNVVYPFYLNEGLGEDAGQAKQEKEENSLIESLELLNALKEKLEAEI